MNRNHMHILKDINMWTKYSQTVLRLLRNANMRLPVWANILRWPLRPVGLLLLYSFETFHNCTLQEEAEVYKFWVHSGTAPCLSVSPSVRQHFRCDAITQKVLLYSFEPLHNCTLQEEAEVYKIWVHSTFIQMSLSFDSLRRGPCWPCHFSSIYNLKMYWIANVISLQIKPSLQ